MTRPVLRFLWQLWRLDRKDRGRWFGRTEIEQRCGYKPRDMSTILRVALCTLDKRGRAMIASHNMRPGFYRISSSARQLLELARDLADEDRLDDARSEVTKRAEKRAGLLRS